jgi:hypothetical protein
MADVCRHGKGCAFEAAAREAFDAYVKAVSQHSSGDLSSQQMRDARAAYDDARDARNRECLGVPA